MKQLLREIADNPLVWALVFVPVIFVVEKVTPESHTLLFILSVCAIIPLAAMLSLATESVAARTGDAVGGLLNVTLGNLTELVIALAALHAGQYMLVKASVAGTIVANTLFVVGGVFSAGRTKASSAGIQSRGRASSGGAALSRYDRAADFFGGCGGRQSLGGGVHRETMDLQFWLRVP